MDYFLAGHTEWCLVEIGVIVIAIGYRSVAVKLDLLADLILLCADDFVDNYPILYQQERGHGLHPKAPRHILYEWGKSQNVSVDPFTSRKKITRRLISEERTYIQLINVDLDELDVSILGG